MRKTISILGCGWYGLELAKHLVSNGYNVKGSTTSTEKLDQLKKEGIEAFLINFQEEHVNYDPIFFNCNALVICIPPKRSSDEQANFAGKISHISKAAANNNIIKGILFISSTSVYGDHNKDVLELDKPNPDSASGKAMIHAENTLLNDHPFKTTVLRFGGLIGPGRDPGRFFAGKINVANGQAPINLIHLSDCIGISTQIIETGAFGHTFNACTPDHPTRQDFYTRATINSGLVAPTFINELTSWKTINTDQTVKLLNYKYQIINWLHWLRKGKL